MTSDSKPFVCSSSHKGNGTVSYVILWDDRYWRVGQWHHDLIMSGSFTPEELELDEYSELKEQDHDL